MCCRGETRSACVVVSFFEGLSSPGAAIVLPSPFFTDLPDQDDIWRPTRLSACAKALQDDPDLGLIFSNGELIDDAGAQTHGLEFFAKYTPVRRWTVSVGMTELRGTSAPGTGFAAVADLCQFE